MVAEMGEEGGGRVWEVVEQERRGGDTGAALWAGKESKQLIIYLAVYFFFRSDE